MNKILTEYSFDINRTIEQILSDQNDLGWIYYRNMITVEDLNYIKNVLSWMGYNISIMVLKINNEEVSIYIGNKIIEKKQQYAKKN